MVIASDLLTWIPGRSFKILVIGKSANATARESPFAARWLLAMIHSLPRSLLAGFIMRRTMIVSPLPILTGYTMHASIGRVRDYPVGTLFSHTSFLNHSLRRLAISIPRAVGNVGIKADIQSTIQSYKLPVVLNRQNGMTTTHVDTRIMTTIDNGPQPRKEWVLGSNMSSGAQRW